MSDKFFFKGRQEARQDHTHVGYKTKAVHKRGSKKYPLLLTVTSEARKAEIETLVADAALFADITVDSSDGAQESTAELMALLNHEGTVTFDKTPERNDPCSCGSGKKYKKCCG